MRRISSHLWHTEAALDATTMGSFKMVASTMAGIRWLVYLLSRERRGKTAT